MTSRVSLHKTGKRSTSEVVSMAHSDKEVAAKIKKTNASEVCKPIPYTPDEALGLYVDGGFSKRSYKLMQTYAYCKEDS